MTPIDRAPPISLAVLWFATVSCFALPGLARSTGPSYTQAQAAAGKIAYEESCSSCHGKSLRGVHLAPALIGERFDTSWRGKSAALLGDALLAMPLEPAGEPGSLSQESYASILAYLLERNGFAPGEQPLSFAASELADLVIPGATDRPQAPASATARDSHLLKNLPDVSQEMLLDPAPGDWLQWGRTYDGHGYTPLTDIHRGNVARLEQAWRKKLPEGEAMPTPVIHHGVLFLHTYPDTVLALDGRNGEELWRYRYQTQRSSKKTGVSLAGNKVLVPTSDLHLVALDVRTGEPLWDHTIVPETDGHPQVPYELRSAPLVVDNLAIQGVTASFAPRGGFILAIDLESGEEVWRFNTIARPGAPGGDTWNGLDLDQRSGGSVWHQGTYDPELGLVYYGVAPTYDTGPLLHPDDDPNTSREALYSNCTVALDAKTGELAWYYQHMPNDQWDLDWVFERQIIDLELEGKQRRVVLNIGKMAILDALDAATGEYLFSIDPGIQNVITAIDPETGEKSYDPEKTPDPERDIVVCPSLFGARSWPPTSYSRDTRLVYAPLTEWCVGMGKQGFQLLTSGVGLTTAAHPRVDDGKVGLVAAYDLEQQKVAWVRDQETPPSTSLLATASGLLFSGDLDPSLKAFDHENGELLFETPLDDQPSSSIVSYEVDDRQYIALVVGLTNNHVRDISRAYRTFTESRSDVAPKPEGDGAAIVVFALEEEAGNP